MKPISEKLNKILEQNAELASGILALADMIKPERKAQIIADYKKAESRITRKPNQSLFDVLSVLDEEEGFETCSVCHL